MTPESCQNLWAIGDCAGTPHFTHAAFDDFRVIRDNLAGGQRTTRDRLIPYCLFTDPELARIDNAVQIAASPSDFTACWQ